MIEFIIDEEYETVRIDRFLRKHLKNIALSEIYKMLRKAKIKVNNKKVSQDYRLVLDDIIFVFLPESFEEKNEEAFIELNEIRKEKLKSMIAYENENLFIITAREIAKEIQLGSITKKYYILVYGKIEKEEFILENYLKKDEEKVIVSDIEKEDYKKSITHYKRINGNDDYTLLEAELKTGRTHQLRAQLSHIGHTIVGDTKYGKNIKEETMYLFSYYLKIDLYDLELEMGIPNFFLKKCDV